MSELKISYYDDKMENGIKYDFQLISKEFKKLKIPKGYHTPLGYPFETCKYFVDVSERSIGKTTNWLLYGMEMHKLYGMKIAYVRQVDSMLAPKNLDIFSTIIECGYVEKLTDGKYHSIYYYGHKWYYCNYDENGKLEEKSADYFMFGFSIDKNENYKSSINIPNIDLIIFDEFCSRRYEPNEFVYFLDLVKTLQRERKSPIIVMLSNTIDKHNEYFQELECYDIIQTMKIGDSITYHTSKGTNIHLSIVSPNEKTKIKKSLTNMLFYGFSNPKLSSITGEDWAFVNYPHANIPDIYQRLRGVYLDFNGRYIGMDICLSDSLGVVVVCHQANQIYDDSIVYTKDELQTYDCRYKFLIQGRNRLEHLLINLYDNNKFYYQNNQIGSMVCNFLRANKKMRGCIR